MGVLNDYFRAPDDAAAASTGERIGGPVDACEGCEPAFDGAATKGIDPSVILGQLLAIRREVDWDVEIVESRLVYPEGPEPDEATMASLPEDSPWMNGPWVERLGDRVRDELATIGDDEVADLAGRWIHAEELAGISDKAVLADLIGDLAGLARRAQAADEHLYCWSSL